MPELIQKALATIEDTDAEAAEHGGFTAVLSTPALDRDGDQLARDEWVEPLPDRITLDMDHEMSVAGTIGSAHPYFDDGGRLMIDATFASTPKAQEVRSLIREGHISTVSVAFMNDRTKKDGVPRRELLNAGVVAIPSNREAVILESKAAAEVLAKAGARNSANDSKMIQAIHDAAGHLGAQCATDADADTGEDDGANKAFEDGLAAAVGTKRPALIVVSKAISGSVEDLKARIDDALNDAYPNNYPWIRATFLDDVGSGTVVYEIGGDTLARSFTDDGTVTVLDGAVRDVSLITTLVDEDGPHTPGGKSAGKPHESADAPAAEAAVVSKTTAADAADKSADDVAPESRAHELVARALATTAIADAMPDSKEVGDA
ncbi:hypothetical protein G4X40_19770 [Rhodococcus sp. D2-41]|uniref:hypothetical protein n=1 Tax=Speluncibacter jeojiensis TaxID=2710754 RepID=UPI0024106D70|nr:hypothetical protein [Rhodococcus sp. D2-41]MDG3012382.1 hypothetical protein [Rhodococcus sp. D2-41]